MSQAVMPHVDRSAPGTLVVRFGVLRPSLWFFGGMAWLAVVAFGFITVATGENPGPDDDSAMLLIGVAMSLVPGYLLFRVAFRRFARAGRSNGIALALDRQGVHVGAEPGGKPRFVPWPDVAGIAALEWSGGEDGKPRYGVGVRVYPGRPGRPEEVFAQLAQLRSRNLSRRQRRSLAALDRTARTESPDQLLSASLMMRDWRVSEEALRAAVAAFRPDVPITRVHGGRTAYWLKHRDRLPLR
jgi:hypothetical protein